MIFRRVVQMVTLTMVGFSALCTFARAEDVEPMVRIKDLVEMRGVRSNQLVGFGLVVGLQGTGDSKASLATNKAVATMLSRLGQTVNPADVTTKNIAAVAVTADLPPFARIGDKIAVRISSVGDAGSLEGGTLLGTLLSGADDLVYVVAQGSLSSGTAMAGIEGGAGSKSTAPKTVALANGGTVEREFEQSFVHNGVLELSLRNADFTTATRISKSVNEYFGEFLADPVNAGLIRVTLPRKVEGNVSFPPVAFVSALEQIRVEPDNRGIVIVNERTGTVISGSNVSISPVAISHGGLEIVVKKKSGYVGEIPATTTVGELVAALNALGAGPKDLVSILQALDAAKALKADLRFL
jgi:flagellar P-ring protein precursor FlgI